MFGFHHHEKPVNPLDTNTTDDLVRKAAASGAKITNQDGPPTFDFDPKHTQVKPEPVAAPAADAQATKAPADELAGPDHEWTDDEVSQIGSPVPPATV